MSNLGFQAVYRLLNRMPDVVCERAFLPDDEDKAELERTGSPLVSFETGTPLRDFDAIAFSVSFENDYLHVLQVLRLAGIPLRAKDRGPRDPLVILGGAAMFLNPEPLAPFADLVAVGEGEPIVPRMMEALLGAADPRKGLEALQPKDGFYVPSRYEVRYHADGTRRRATTAPAACARQRGWPGTMGFPQSVDPHPAHRDVDEVHGRDLARLPVHVPLLLGGLQLPAGARLHARRARGAGARGARGHEQDRPRLDRGLRPPRDRRASWTTSRRWTTRSRSPRCASTTSRRSSCFKLADTGVQGLTLAPECGSDRMRRILNKQFTNAEILDKATWIFENGIAEPEALLHGRAPLRGARRRRGDRRAHRADPRADARRSPAAAAASAASTPR